MTTTELLAALAAAQTGEPAQSVESAIAVYLGAKAQMAYTTKAGKASITAPSVSVSYDAKALDALAASDDGIARLLAPHRKATERAGTMRITASK